MLLNIHCLRSESNKDTKIRFIEEFAIDRRLSFIALCETWLTPSVLDAEVQIYGYTLHRSDCHRPGNPNYPHGGVCLYIDQTLGSSSCAFTNGYIEIIVCEICSISTTLVTVYRPPNCPFEKLQEALQYIQESVQPSTNLLVLGDLNFSKDVARWIKSEETGYFPLPISALSSSPRARSFSLFEDFFFDMGLSQHFGENTHATSILDLVMSNHYQIVGQTDVQTNSISDHKLIQIKTRICLQPKHKTQNHSNYIGLSGYSLKDEHWPLIKEEMSKCNIIAETQGKSDCEGAFTCLLALLEKVFQKVGIPKKKASRNPHTIPNDRRKLFRKRCVLIKKLTKNISKYKRNGIFKKLEVIHQNIISSISTEAKEIEARAIEAIKSNPKYFYTYAKEKKSVFTTIGPFNLDGCVISSECDMAEVLSEQFKGAWTTPCQFARNEYPITPSSITEVCINEETVRTAIKSLNKSSSPGPDGIPSSLLIECIDFFAPIIQSLMEKSMKEGDLPSLLKLA